MRRPASNPRASKRMLAQRICQELSRQHAGTKARPPSVVTNAVETKKPPVKRPPTVATLETKSRSDRPTLRPATAVKRPPSLVTRRSAPNRKHEEKEEEQVDRQSLTDEP